MLITLFKSSLCDKFSKLRPSPLQAHSKCSNFHVPIPHAHSTCSNFVATHASKSVVNINN